MYIIIGGTGFLGSYMVNAVLERTSENIMVVARVRKNLTAWAGKINFVKCDISNKAELDELIVKINSIQEPSKVIFLSACHNPELVEESPWVSWKLNVISLNYLLSKLHPVKNFIFASTDAVYGESIDGYRYRENDMANPVSLYGIQKKAGEAVVSHYGYHSFRYSLMIGHSLIDGRKHFYDIILGNLIEGKNIELFTDAIRCMLDFKSAAKLTVNLIEYHGEKLPAVLNISGDEAFSKYDVGIKLAQQYGKQEELIIPISITDNNRIFKVKRASTILTDNSVLKELLNLEKVELHV